MPGVTSSSSIQQPSLDQIEWACLAMQDGMKVDRSTYRVYDTKKSWKAWIYVAFASIFRSDDFKEANVTAKVWSDLTAKLVEVATKTPTMPREKRGKLEAEKQRLEELHNNAGSLRYPVKKEQYNLAKQNIEKEVMKASKKFEKAKRELEEQEKLFEDAALLGTAEISTNENNENIDLLIAARDQFSQARIQLMDAQNQFCADAQSLRSAIKERLLEINSLLDNEPDKVYESTKERCTEIAGLISGSLFQTLASKTYSEALTSLGPDARVSHDTAFTSMIGPDED
jgi:hypothetical protein